MSAGSSIATNFPHGGADGDGASSGCESLCGPIGAHFFRGNGLASTDFGHLRNAFCGAFQLSELELGFIDDELDIDQDLLLDHPADRRRMGISTGSVTRRSPVGASAVAAMSCSQCSLMRGDRFPLNRNRISVEGLIHRVSRPLPMSVDLSKQNAALLPARSRLSKTIFR